MSQRLSPRERAEIKQDIEDLAAITSALRVRAIMREGDCRLLVYIYEIAALELARQRAELKAAYQLEIL